MNTLDALLSGIVADPLEETRWLVLADWLEENDDPRRRAGRLRLAPRKLLATCCEPDAHPEKAGLAARMVELPHCGCGAVRAAAHARIAWRKPPLVGRSIHPARFVPDGRNDRCRRATGSPCDADTGIFPGDSPGHSGPVEGHRGNGAKSLQGVEQALSLRTNASPPSAPTMGDAS